MDDDQKRGRSQSPPTLAAKGTLTINEILNQPKKSLETPAQGHLTPNPAKSIIQPPKTWFKTCEQLLEERHPATMSAKSISESRPNVTTTTLANNSKTVKETSTRDDTVDQSSTAADKHDRAPSNPTKSHSQDINQMVRTLQPLAPKECTSTPSQSLPKESVQWKNSFLSREQHVQAPFSAHSRRLPAQSGPSSTLNRTPQLATSALPGMSKLSSESLTSTGSRKSTNSIPDTRAYTSATSQDTRHPPLTQPGARASQSQHGNYNYGVQQTAQHVLRPRPSTPGGTIIMLPANSATAYDTGLESNGNIDVKRLARWASYHADWAEYLRAGGGNEEAWWLYRRMKGFSGYNVSGWHEIYEERDRQARKAREEARTADRTAENVSVSVVGVGPHNDDRSTSIG